MAGLALGLLGGTAIGLTVAGAGKNSGGWYAPPGVTMREMRAPPPHNLAFYAPTDAEMKQQQKALEDFLNGDLTIDNLRNNFPDLENFLEEQDFRNYELFFKPAVLNAFPELFSEKRLTLAVLTNLSFSLIQSFIREDNGDGTKLFSRMIHVFDRIPTEERSYASEFILSYFFENWEDSAASLFYEPPETLPPVMTFTPPKEFTFLFIFLLGKKPENAEKYTEQVKELGFTI